MLQKQLDHMIKVGIIAADRGEMMPSQDGQAGHDNNGGKKYDSWQYLLGKRAIFGKVD